MLGQIPDQQSTFHAWRICNRWTIHPYRSEKESGKMSTPKFSVVVPTRNRPHTLPATLRSIFAARGNDYEVVLVDNASEYSVEDVIKSFDTSRIKYLRSDQVLPMTENWTKGLEATSGTYISVLGDDDGFLPSTFELASQIIDKTRAKILTWAPHGYWWPDAIVWWQQNRLYVNFGRGGGWCNAANALKLFYQGKFQWSQLPMIYSSFIHREVYETTRQRFGAYIPIPHCPDIISGIVNLLATDQYIFSNRPLSIRGNSGRSNGTAFWARSLGHNVREQFLAEERVSVSQLYHRDLIPSYNLELMIANVKLLCKERLFPDRVDLTLDFRKLVANMLTTLNREPESYDDNLQEALALARKHNVAIPAGFIPAKSPIARQASAAGPIVNNDVIAGICVDCALARVTDVAEAASMAEALLEPASVAF